jgi:hypothetical protein
MGGYLNRAQYDQLIKPINPRRVGKDGKGFSHIESFEARAHLNRVLGYARWSAEVTAMENIFDTETKGEKGTRYTVCYRAAVKLTVCAPDGTVLATYTEWATGEATNQPSRGDAHDLSIKTAESQALKRAAINLGDGWGLGLYAKGSLSAIVGRSLVVPDETEPSANASSVDEHVVFVPEGPAPIPTDTHVQSAPPTQTPDTDALTLRVKDLTAQLLAATTRSAVGGLAGQIGKEKLGAALTDDGQGNVLTVSALLDQALKRVTRSAA